MRSIIFLTRTTPPPMRRPSTHTSIPMISPAHGAPSPQSHYSFPAFPPVPKCPYMTWQKHTEQFLLTLPNGPGWSYDYKPTISLQLTSAITLAFPQRAEHMACWLMQGWTFSGRKGWACSQSGWTTIFSFESPAVIFPVTTLNVMNGTARSW